MGFLNTVFGLNKRGGLNEVSGINKFAGFNNPPTTTTPGATLLLDGVTTSAVYSLRRLKTSYTGPLIKVRRSNDNAVADIGYDVNNVLDQTALLAHTGANSGFIDTWYDQSGNGNHATQATAANQPRIVNAGVVQTQNSLPTLNFNGSSQRLTLSGNGLKILNNVSGAAGFAIVQSANTAANQSPFNIHSGASSSNGRLALVKNTSNRIQAVCKALDTDTGIFASNAVDNAALKNWTIIAEYTVPNCTLYSNNVSAGNSNTGSTAGNTDTTDSLAVYIGCRGTGVTANTFWNGNISELIWLAYVPDTTLRTSISSNQTTFYGT